MASQSNMNPNRLGGARQPDQGAPSSSGPFGPNTLRSFSQNHQAAFNRNLPLNMNLNNRARLGSSSPGVAAAPAGGFQQGYPKSQDGQNTPGPGVVTSGLRLNEYHPTLSTGMSDVRIQNAVIENPIIRALIVPECDMEARRRCMNLISKILMAATPVLHAMTAFSYKPLEQNQANNSAGDKSASGSMNQYGHSTASTKLLVEQYNHIISLIAKTNPNNTLVLFWLAHHLQNLEKEISVLCPNLPLLPKPILRPSYNTSNSADPTTGNPNNTNGNNGENKQPKPGKSNSAASKDPTTNAFNSAYPSNQPSAPTLSSTSQPLQNPGATSSSKPSPPSSPPPSPLDVSPVLSPLPTRDLYTRIHESKCIIQDLADRIQGAVCMVFWESWDAVYELVAEIVGYEVVAMVEKGRIFRPSGSAAIYITRKKRVVKEREEMKMRMLKAQERHTKSKGSSSFNSSQTAGSKSKGSEQTSNPTSPSNEEGGPAKPLSPLLSPPDQSYFEPLEKFKINMHDNPYLAQLAFDFHNQQLKKNEPGYQGSDNSNTNAANKQKPVNTNQNANRSANGQETNVNLGNTSTGISNAGNDDDDEWPFRLSSAPDGATPNSLDEIPRTPSIGNNSLNPSNNTNQNSRANISNSNNNSNSVSLIDSSELDDLIVDALGTKKNNINSENDDKRKNSRKDNASGDFDNVVNDTSRGRKRKPIEKNSNPDSAAASTDKSPQTISNDSNDNSTSDNKVGLPFINSDGIFDQEMFMQHALFGSDSAALQGFPGIPEMPNMSNMNLNNLNMGINMGISMGMASLGINMNSVGDVNGGNKNKKAGTGSNSGNNSFKVGSPNDSMSSMQSPVNGLNGMFSMSPSSMSSSNSNPMPKSRSNSICIGEVQVGHNGPNRNHMYNQKLPINNNNYGNMNGHGVRHPSIPGNMTPSKRNFPFGDSNMNGNNSNNNNNANNNNNNDKDDEFSFLRKRIRLLEEMEDNDSSSRRRAQQQQFQVQQFQQQLHNLQSQIQQSQNNGGFLSPSSVGAPSPSFNNNGGTSPSMSNSKINSNPNNHKRKLSQAQHQHPNLQVHTHHNHPMSAADKVIWGQLHGAEMLKGSTIKVPMSMNGNNPNNNSNSNNNNNPNNSNNGNGNGNGGNGMNGM